eukprot:1979639-Rhodomonas_salina.5
MCGTDVMRGAARCVAWCSGGCCFRRRPKDMDEDDEEDEGPGLCRNQEDDEEKQEKRTVPGVDIDMLHTHTSREKFLLSHMLHAYAHAKRSPVLTCRV